MRLVSCPKLSPSLPRPPIIPATPPLNTLPTLVTLGSRLIPVFTLRDNSPQDEVYLKTDFPSSGSVGVHGSLRPLNQQAGLSLACQVRCWLWTTIAALLTVEPCGTLRQWGAHSDRNLFRFNNSFVQTAKETDRNWCSWRLFVSETTDSMYLYTRLEGMLACVTLMLPVVFYPSSTPACLLTEIALLVYIPISLSPLTEQFKFNHSKGKLYFRSTTHCSVNTGHLACGYSFSAGRYIINSIPWWWLYVYIPQAI